MVKKKEQKKEVSKTGTIKCQYCGRECNPRGLNNHERFCKSNPDLKSKKTKKTKRSESERPVLDKPKEIPSFQPESIGDIDEILPEIGEIQTEFVDPICPYCGAIDPKVTAMLKWALQSMAGNKRLSEIINIRPINAKSFRVKCSVCRNDFDIKLGIMELVKIKNIDGVEIEDRSDDKDKNVNPEDKTITVIKSSRAETIS